MLLHKCFGNFDVRYPNSWEGEAGKVPAFCLLQMLNLMEIYFYPEIHGYGNVPFDRFIQSSSLYGQSRVNGQ